MCPFFFLLKRLPARARQCASDAYTEQKQYIKLETDVSYFSSSHLEQTETMSSQQDKIDAKVGNDHAHDAFDPSE